MVAMIFMPTVFVGVVVFQLSIVNDCVENAVIKRFVLSLILLLLASASYADELLIIVTPRNAPEMVAGAHAFLQQSRQQTQVQIRTTEQWQEMMRHQQQQLLQQANMVFAGGVFGETANSLHDYLQQGLISNFIALHSEHRLVTGSVLYGRPLLNPAALDSLMQHPDANKPTSVWMEQMLARFPEQRAWLLARLFWLGRNSVNMHGLLSHLHHLHNGTATPVKPELAAQLRLYHQGTLQTPERFDFAAKKSWVVLLDYETGERPGEKALLDAVCKPFIDTDIGCVTVLTAWGRASLSAVEMLAAQRNRISSIVSLQNFVIGGSEQRQAVTEQLKQLDVPVLKAIRLSDSTEAAWRLSEEGLQWDSVHYRVAMPELQGISQPIVVAAMTEPEIDQQTGARLAFSQPIASQVVLLSDRLKRWQQLQQKANKDKKVAVIYYNHPPGRHNIGADNLNVVESLFEILTTMQAQGYTTGKLPATAEALLDLLQQRGVNLPEDAGALADMAGKVQTVSSAQYRQWFDSLPETLRREMVSGPLGLLHSSLRQAMVLQDTAVAEHLLKRVMEDLHHAVDGAEHAGRERVLNLLSQLQAVYQHPADKVDWRQAETLIAAITEQGIEGLRGWGEAPGKVMVYQDQILLPGIRFGNVFVGPQPPRGWELNEELLHANLSFPPPHQYLAFYQWLQNSFQADALVHLGRHSTYEFLPRHRVGMADNDYPQAVLADLPSIYPYIVDGVGEGIQAKRRGLAVMVDHLTPPLASTDLYDQLLELRQLVESYEAAPVNADAMRKRAMTEMKRLLAALNLQDELTASMSAELQVRGLTSFEQVDDELLVHEIGHYLTKLQEDFMPLGLHVFGRDWSEQAVTTMLESMRSASHEEQHWAPLLKASPQAEITALLHALDGRYVTPGKGNDPIRTPAALPTGRNFYALDGSLIPSRLGYQVGIELAAKARLAGQGADDLASDALVLWASDVVRDEGAMIAFAFDMLGVRPEWNSRGIFKGLTRLDISNMTDTNAQSRNMPRIRHDMLFTTSGLFRDLYGGQIIWLEQAVLMALNASAGLIREQYPALTLALDAALAPLQTSGSPGFEPLTLNRVAARWVQDASEALRSGTAASQAGRQASYRIFGAPPGSYGAGVNRLVERSGAWQHRSEITRTYIHRMGHAYGAALQGEGMQSLFRQRLQHVRHTYLGRSSNLYGVIDNNDAFDYLGGLSLAVETVQGQAPQNFILAHSDSKNIGIEPLQTALLGELRNRYLNPQWLQPLMAEGYAGARTMGSEFLEYLWGWQVTNPGVVKSWVWDEVKRVYIDDALDLGLDRFLEQDHNVHVKSNMVAIMLVAAHKGFWDADKQTIEQLAAMFTELVATHGLPGSGHTTPNHPVYAWLADYLDEQQLQQLQTVLAAAQLPEPAPLSAPSRVTEVMPAQAQDKADTHTAAEDPHHQAAEWQATYWQYLLAGLAVILLAIGLMRGASLPQPNKSNKRG